MNFLDSGQLLKFLHCLEFEIVSQAHLLLICHNIQVGVAYLKWVPPFRGIYKRILKNMNKFRGRMEALVKEAKGSFSDGEVVSLKMTMTMSDFLSFRCEATSTCS